MDQQGQSSAPQPAPAGTPPPATPETAAPVATPAPEATPAGTPPPATAATPPAESTSKKSHAKMLIIMLVLVLLVVAGIIAWQMYFKPVSMTQDASMIKTTVSPTEAVMISPTEGPVASGDSELDKQSATIDENIEKVNKDVTEAVQGLQDKPTDLSQ